MSEAGQLLSALDYLFARSNPSRLSTSTAHKQQSTRMQTRVNRPRDGSLDQTGQKGRNLNCVGEHPSRSSGSALLLLVVHNHFVERLAVFIGSIHSEGGCLTVFRQNRFALGSSAIHVPGVLVGVIVHFSHGHCHIVPAEDLYRLSLYRRVVPTGALAIRTGFIDGDRTIRVNHAHVNLRWRPWEFGFFKVRRPRTGKTAGRYTSDRLRDDKEGECQQQEGSFHS
jgi:hypothetical protein